MYVYTMPCACVLLQTKITERDYVQWGGALVADHGKYVLRVRTQMRMARPVHVRALVSARARTVANCSLLLLESWRIHGKGCSSVWVGCTQIMFGCKMISIGIRVSLQ